MKKILISLFVLVFCGAVVSADEFNPQKEIKSVREDVDVIKKELNEIKQAIISLIPVIVAGKKDDKSLRPAESNETKIVSVDISDILNSQFQGNKEADIALIEFSDLQCPACAKFHREAATQLKRNYFDTGKILYVYKDFPLDNHRDAVGLAVAARCAGEQGKYFEMQENIFKNSLTVAAIENASKKMGLDDSIFKKCIETYDREKINADIHIGAAIGVRGTPSFVIGRLEKNIVTGELVMGAFPYEYFQRKFDEIRQKGRK